MNKTAEAIKELSQTFLLQVEGLTREVKAEIEAMKGEIKELRAGNAPLSPQKEDLPQAVLPEKGWGVPFEYRQIVETVLNKKFGIEVEPLADRPAFLFRVIVPKEYSNATENHWRVYGMDERVKVISLAEGINGVREWCDKVFKNFNQDMRTIIVTDRTKL